MGFLVFSLYKYPSPDKALCYPKNDREDIGKLGAKGDIGFFIVYSADSCAYRIYNRRTKKIMKTMNVSFDELSAMALEQRSSKPGLQSMTSGQISSGLDLTYAPSTITTQQPSEGEFDLLFEAMYDDYIGGQPSTALRIVPATHAHQVRQDLTTSTSIAVSAPTPTNSSSHATNFPNTSQDVDELNSQQQHAQQQRNQAHLQSETVADNVPNAMFDGNTSGLDLTYASSTITTQQPTEGELDLLFEDMYDDYIDSAPTPTNSSSLATNFPITSQDVDELNSQQQHAQQQGNQAHLQSKTVDDNVPNAMFDGNTFVNPFANPSTSAAESSSSQNVDPSNMHMFYQPYPQDVYVCQTEGFIDAYHPSHVYKLKKALYGLKQAPRAWLSTFLLQNHFFKGTIDPTLFIRHFHDDILVVQVYVDDIIFGSTHPRLSQSRSTSRRLKGSFVISREPLIGVFGEKLVSWSSKKQDCTELSTVEAKYVSLSACCAQVLLMWTQLTDYGFSFNKIPIYCDSKSAIAISYNLVQHSRTKHIAVRYHFIKEHMEKGTIELYFVKMDYQLADLFTKALPADRFNYLVRRLGMRSLSPQELDRLAKSQ
nr:retrovirus-related Pol polyprotein from transposon TNT 1-94 [Tanacetum cinerariifolium]